MGLEVFHEAVLAVRAANARLAPSGVEALHGLEVFAVDVGLAKLQAVDTLVV